MAKEFNELLDDVFDIRDVIERREELQAEREDLENSDLPENHKQKALTAWDGSEEGLELKAILDFMEKVKGNGGDEQWEGDWYPVTFINESYFPDYTEELVKDCCDLPRDIPGYIAIDWNKTAGNIKVDYTSVEIGTDTYWYR